MPRFFLEEIDKTCPKITGSDANHIGRSLRMKPGEKLTICVSGTDYKCEIASVTPEEVFLNILSSEPCVAEPSIKLTLFQAMPKSDKLEQIVQKSVELGVSEIVPVITRRCISRPSERDFSKKLERYNKIALSAAKQSGRGMIPRVALAVDLDTAIDRMLETDCPVMLYEAGGIRFSQLETEGKKNFSLLVGSEGGFDPEEAEKALNAGIPSIWLGERILRCETAPLAATAILMYLTKNL